MPLREVHAKYTQSELGIQAWRSGEIASDMHSKYSQGSTDRATGALTSGNPVPTAAETVLEERLGSDLVSKLDEDLDFRKLTGDEVMRFMGAMGVGVTGRMLAGGPRG